MSSVPLTTTFPLFVGEHFAPDRDTRTLPSAIAADLDDAACHGIFPSGAGFAIFSTRHRGALEVRIVVHGLGNDFLFAPDSSLTAEAADLHTQVTAIASAYNSVSSDDPRTAAVHRIYRLEVSLETDIERRQRRGRFAALSVLVALWALAGLAAGTALIATAPLQSTTALLALLVPCSVLAPFAYVCQMASRWAAPAAAPKPQEDVQ